MYYILVIEVWYNVFFLFFNMICIIFVCFCLIIMFKSFLVRIYPSNSQKEFFAKQFGCCRYVYNTFLDEKKLEYSLFHRNLSYNECSKNVN